MAEGIRRVAITDDDADGFSSRYEAWETYDDGPPAHVADEYNEYEDQPGDRPFEQEVNQLLGRGWSVAMIANFLLADEGEVRDADNSDDDDDDFRQTPAEAYGLEPDFE